MVINPTAGSGRAKADGAAVTQRLQAHGFGVIDLTGESLDGAAARVRQGVAEGLDAIIVVGGDGMSHLGVNAVAGTSLPLGIVAVGTGNDIARSLGLPIHDVKAAVDVIERGWTVGGRPVDAARVRGAGHHASEWFFGVLSGGFDAAVNERANTTRWPRGKLRYVRSMLAELGQLRSYDYKVTIDGALAWDGPGILAAVANGMAFGGGLLIAPGAAMDDGLLEVVMAKPLSRRALLTVFPKLYRGRHVDHPAVSFFSGARVLIETGAPRGRRAVSPPVAYADGERMGPVPIECIVVPHAVRLLQPPKWSQDA